MIHSLRQRWQGPGGFAELLQLAIPLVISTSAHSIQLFSDRMFLMWHSQQAMSAAMQSGITHFCLLAIFFGITSYVNTFVAQYIGANRTNRVGAAVWQGIYVALIGGLAMLALIPISGMIFDRFDHSPQVRAYEIIYFDYMCVTSLPVLISVAISSFYTAQKKTMIVMYVTLVGSVFNIILDYLLIFGKFGFPAYGFLGAPRATLCAGIITCVIYLVLFFRRSERMEFMTLAGAKLEWNLLGRLIRFGLPSGIQIFSEILPFTLFMMFIGRLGASELSASVIAFQINTLAFLPMIGFGIAVTTLVGQALGDDKPKIARRTTLSAATLCLGYMTLVAAGFIIFPNFFIYPFAVGSHAQEFAILRPIVVNLLYFIAFYCLFDTGNIIFSATLKGAGDTRFVMFASIILNWTILILPTYLAWRLGWGLYAIWGFATSFVTLSAITYFLRYLSGKWESMRVIESAPLSVPILLPDVPAAEAEVPGASQKVIHDDPSNKS